MDQVGQHPPWPERGVGHTAADGPALSALLSRTNAKLLFHFTDDARSRLDRLYLEPSSGPKMTANRWLERR